MLAEWFQQNTDPFSIRAPFTPLQAANLITIGDRYHDSARQAYRTVKEGSLLVQQAGSTNGCQTVNNSAGQDGIRPRLAVYGTVARFSLLRDRPLISIHRRAIAFGKVTQAFTKRFSSGQARNALCSRNKLNVAVIPSTIIGSYVLVYRIERDRCNTPYTTLDTYQAVFYMLLPHSQSKFWSTLVKTFVTPD